MRILIFGAGVIGRIYAARLLSAGHEVSVLSRGVATNELRDAGICLRRDGVDDIRAFPRVIENLSDAGQVHLALVAIGLDQVDTALGSLGQLEADVVASFINLPLGSNQFRQTIGADRFVPAFPGVAGRPGSHGTVGYVALAQQPTTICAGAAGDLVASAVSSAGFSVARVDDMDGWLKTHAIFISAIESALVAVSGDAHSLASDRPAVRRLVLAVREGFTALHDRGVGISPPALKIIFQRMPVWFATGYWSRQLEGELGQQAFAPHALASRYGELPALQRDVRSLLGGTVPPRLARLFASAQ